ncbi:MAG: molybdenum cofactor biosynthesis protein MoaE [Deltaproteobacteria bacterium]|nr:MAG: molybdenum cofactor biosynthesis protein MoaE [Deltaproteobacteria bacterium]
MEITVRYFAAARDLAGCDEEDIRVEAGELSAGAMLEVLAERHPRLRGYVERMRVAINGEFANASASLSTGDVIDVLPPVAGGGPVALVAIRDTPLSLDECLTAVLHPGAGGVALFVGTVRDHADGKPVARLDYEAHPELAEKEATRVLAKITEEMPGVRLAMTHRMGQLRVGDLAVVVAASSAHRGDAFDACRLVIDRVKETVPIWKKEWGPDGEAHWVNLAE